MRKAKSAVPARIVQAGELVLRQKARALGREELLGGEMQRLIATMRETMHAAPGVGLAAPQIGIGLQIAVIEDKQDYTKDAPPDFVRERERQPVPFHAIVNPTLTVLDAERAEFFEGCLSLAGFTAVVSRARRVRVECWDERAERVVIEASGWYARILQHEIDHLQGTLYIDRMKTRTFSSLENFEANYKGRSMAEVKAIIGWE